MNNKVVLISNSGYSKKHDELIEKILNSSPELICVWGKDCELLEEIIDELAVGDGTNVRYVTTSAHPNETLNEVLQFAKNWQADNPSSVEQIEI